MKGGGGDRRARWGWRVWEWPVEAWWRWTRGVDLRSGRAWATPRMARESEDAYRRMLEWIERHPEPEAGSEDMAGPVHRVPEARVLGACQGDPVEPEPGSMKTLIAFFQSVAEAAREVSSLISVLGKLDAEDIALIRKAVRRAFEDGPPPGPLQ